MPFKFQHLKTCQKSHPPHQKRRGKHCGPGIPAVGGGKHAGEIGTQTEKAGMSQGDLSSIPQKEVKGYGQQGVNAYKHQHVQQVPTFEKNGASSTQRANIPNLINSLFTPFTPSPIPVCRTAPVAAERGSTIG